MKRRSVELFPLSENLSHKENEMKKYFGWIFAVATCASLTAFAQDNDATDEVDNNTEDQVAIVLDEVEDSE